MKISRSMVYIPPPILCSYYGVSFVDVYLHACIQHACTCMLLLLLQGLSDSEETVVRMTIEAMTTLCEEKLFDQQTLLENVSSLVPYLIHPVSTSLSLSSFPPSIFSSSPSNLPPLSFPLSHPLFIHHSF